MNKGFELLVPASRDKEMEIQALEAKSGFTLPSLYRDFLKKFDHGRSNLLKAHYKVKIFDKEQYYPFTYIKSINNNEIILDYFEYFDDINRLWDNDVDDRYLKHKLLIIGGHGDVGTGFICVGYGEENQDQIFGIMDEGYDDDPTFPFILGKYAENIFDFVESLCEVRFEDFSPEIEPVYCCFWETGMKKPFR